MSSSSFYAKKGVLAELLGQGPRDGPPDGAAWASRKEMPKSTTVQAVLNPCVQLRLHARAVPPSLAWDGGLPLRGAKHF